MHIGLDLLCLSGEHTGMYRQAWWLAYWMPKLAPDARFTLFVNPGIDPPDDHENQEIVRIPQGRYRGSRVVSEQLHLPRIAERHSIDLLHTIGYGSPALYAGTRILTVHDLGFRLHPETARLRYRLYWNWAYGPAARNCRRLIAVSDSTKRLVVEHLGRKPEEVSVVQCGIDPAFCMDDPLGSGARTGPSLDLPARYVLFVGTRQPRKDLDTLFRAFARIHREHADVHLVIARGSGWGYADARSRLQELEIEQNVHITGFVPQPLMPQLFRRARLLMFPSRHEGFGLPLLEAMASGTPVVATNNSSIPEVTGGAALLAPTGDADAIARQAIRLLEDSDLRERQVANGLAWSRRFTWEEAARKTLSVYREVLGPSTGVCDAVPAAQGEV